MMNVKTYDVASMTVDSARERFKDRYTISVNNTNFLKQKCEYIDEIIEEFCCESLEIDIDDCMNIVVSVTCPDVVLEYGRSHMFFDLINGVSYVSFSAEGDLLKIDFVFSNMWEKIS